MTSLAALRELYLVELRGLRSAELQLVEALPTFAETAADPQLRELLQEHTGQAAHHARRLGEVLRRLGDDPGQGRRDAAMERLIEVTSAAAQAAADSRIRDAALIVSRRKIGHYEIAGYECVWGLALMSDDENAVDTLRQSLREACEADEDLAELAASIINPQAPWMRESRSVAGG